MASTSEDWDGAEILAKWRQLGEQGLEASLCEAGCSKDEISKICHLDRSQKEITFSELQFHLSSKERPVFYASVGRAGSSVKNLDSGSVQWFTRNEAAALCANLTSNTNIEELHFEGILVLGMVKGCTLLGNALRANSTVKRLDLRNVSTNDDAVKFLMDGLQHNKTLLSLDLSSNPLSEEGIKFVAEFVDGNVTLKTLTLKDIRIGFRGASYISSALGRNSTLEELCLGPFTGDSVKKLLKPFSQDIQESEIAKNTTIKKLHLWYLVSTDQAAVKSMIRMNKSLSTLHIVNSKLKREDWRDEIFPALKENKTIQELLLGGLGFIGEDVEAALLDLVRSSKLLATVNIHGILGSEWQGRVNEELRLNSEYRTRLMSQATVQIMAGRLILCGFGYAGKTTISETMEHICHNSARSRSNISKRKIMQTFPCLQQMVYGSGVYRELASRTRGFNVVSLDTKGYLKSIWDFGGQKAYYALHDYLFPNNKNSCFLYVSSARCPPTAQDRMGAIKSEEKMRTECEYWMKFIASNAKPHLAGDRNENHLPQVRFVMTNKDTLTPQQLHTSRQWAQGVVRDLKEVFNNVLHLCEIVEVVNAHSCEDVRHLVTLTEESLTEILEHQREYTICQDVQNILAQQHVDNRVMSLDDFYNLREGEFSFHDSPIKEAVIAYLNDLGEVIYPKGFEFIVINPRWFGISVLGSLIETFKGVEGDAQPACINLCRRHMESLGLVHKNGFADRKAMEDLLKDSLQITHLQQTISGKKLIDLMIHLELCFESQPGNVDSPIFFPTLFDDDEEAACKGERQLKWELKHNETYFHLGRRLECENKEVTFLTPGFFPRLQVCLRNYFHEKSWTKNSVFHVDRNLICFGENGIEVLVEYSGEVGYFLDILVRYSKAHAETLKFIEHVISKIRDFCASPQGCQGVLLVEAVIRPVCVEELHLCLQRRDYAVLILSLKKAFRKDTGYKHIWTSPGDAEHMDYAVDLLKGQDSYRRFPAASRVAEIPETSCSTSSRTFPTDFQLSL